MILNVAFEDWSVQAGAFDLAISADAFHWIQPEIGYPKVACALRPAGKLVFFWNTPSEMEPEIDKALANVYKSRAPQAEKPERRFTEDWMIRTITDFISQSGCYSDIIVKSYQVTETQCTDHYIKDVWTYSSHQSQDRGKRECLYEGIRRALDRFGGKITTTRRVILFMAGKK